MNNKLKGGEINRKQATIQQAGQKRFTGDLY